ncbi:hypothetical protein L7F22_038950 [Adiantum nelumboides]|jgi:prephenate dehydratase|nr:hypothetical protein [Adiantum nelumboides]
MTMNGSSRKPIVLHYLGPPGTYSHQVSLDILPNLHFTRRYSDERGKGTEEVLQVTLKPCKSINETMKEAQDLAKQSNLFSLALLPFENNSNGPVQDSYDILHNAVASSSKFTVVSEAYLPVSHSLLVTKEVWSYLKGSKDKVELSDLEQLDEISSHPQALGQCSKFIEDHMRADIELHNSNSTGKAAQSLLKRPSEESDAYRLRACIASKVCTKADVYDLVEVFGNIQNSNGNTTRFILCRVKEGIEQDQSFDEEYQKVNKKSIDRCRFIFHLTQKNMYDDSLIKFIDSVRRADVFDPDYSRKYPDPVNLEIKIRKVDRSTIRFNDPEEDNDSSSGFTNTEGIWGYTYLVELELSQVESGMVMSRETSDGKRRKIFEKIQFSKLERAVSRYLSETDANFYWDKIPSKVRLLGYWYM